MQAPTLNNNSPTYFQDRADIAEGIRSGRYRGEVLRKAACTLAACTMPMSVEDLGGEDAPNGYTARVVFERIAEVLRWDIGV